MESFEIYKDIQARTGGDIYIGVVGPVRTGKSTFIRRFMEVMVLPDIHDPYVSGQIIDELPQSGTGRTVMTTEPKFVPAEAVEISPADNIKCRVRLIDCVGYMVDGALGTMEGDNKRMITTPWYENPVPFEEAAETGTRKVITEHSTIGIVVITDGSVGDIARENYIPAEERVINELKQLNKPFVVILNTLYPHSADTIILQDALSKKYNIPVISVNCEQMNEREIRNIIETTLYEFPVSQVDFYLPGFIDGLDSDHRIKSRLTGLLLDWSSGISRLRDVMDFSNVLSDGDIISNVFIENVDPGTGNVTIRMEGVRSLYYSVLGEIMECEVDNDAQFFKQIKNYAYAKKTYDKLATALEQVENSGYGIVQPNLAEMILEDPETYKQGNKYGVRIKAKAPSLHIIKTDITTEVSPIVGSEKQSKDLVTFLMNRQNENPSMIWETNLFGKTLYEMVTEQIESKLTSVPDQLLFKVQRSLQKISDEGKDYFICVII